MGYRIDKAGRIASELTVGAEPLLKLAATIVADQDEARVPGNGSASSGSSVYPSLARSRLNRNGLRAVTLLRPVFRLPLRRSRPGCAPRLLFHQPAYLITGVDR